MGSLLLVNGHIHTQDPACAGATATIVAAATAKAAEMGVTDKTKANILMGSLMKDLKGKADGKLVKEMVEKYLGAN